MPQPTHPILRRLGFTLALIVTFVILFVLILAPFFYNASLYYGYYHVGTAIVHGDMVTAKRSLQLLYRYRGCIYVLGALMYGGLLVYDAVEGGRDHTGENGLKEGDEPKGGGGGGGWTMVETIELCVCLILLGYGGALMWYGWMV